MRKAILIIILFLPLLAIGQSNNVQSAANALGYYEKGTSADPKDFELENAKKYIDLSAENESTANNAKMWYYRAKIYQALHNNKRLKTLDAYASEKAVISFINCLKTDSKKMYSDECKSLVWLAGINVYDDAIQFAQKNEFNTAMRYYNLLFEVFPLDADDNLKRNNITPELVEKSIAYTALKANDPATAKANFQKLIDKNFNDPKIYVNMAKISLEEKDTAAAIKYVEKGKAIFEDNTTLITLEMNIYLAQGKTDVLINKLSESIESNPDNELLFFNRGMMYESKKNFDSAAVDYRKALEINPDHLDANYNLGVMYFNEAASMANAANSLKNNDEFAKAKEKFDKKFKDAAPYLEEALRVNNQKTEDEQMMYTATLNSLKQLYVRTGEMEKYAKIKALLEK
ncbi:MAG: tetratricopeptide repeat protein [Bacteroidetes bacterium]|nr:MAG: tetratricopeptide repeat protein [Bacteroidota bacterium]